VAKPSTLKTRRLTSSMQRAAVEQLLGVLLMHNRFAAR